MGSENFGALSYDGVGGALGVYRTILAGIKERTRGFRRYNFETLLYHLTVNLGTSAS